MIELVFSREEWLLGDEFEQHTAETPNIHLLVVVTVGHEALWGAVPSGADVVSVGCWRVAPLARAQVSQLDHVTLHKDVFRLDITVENALSVHELNRAHHLKHVKLYFLVCEGVLLILQTLVQVHVHQLKH